MKWFLKSMHKQKCEQSTCTLPWFWLHCGTTSEYTPSDVEACNGNNSRAVVLARRRHCQVVARLIAGHWRTQVCVFVQTCQRTESFLTVLTCALLCLWQKLRTVSISQRQRDAVRQTGNATTIHGCWQGPPSLEVFGQCAFPSSKMLLLAPCTPKSRDHFLSCPACISIQPGLRWA